MSRKIIGVTVGSPLPKPNLMQDDPTKGDYVKGKDIIPSKVSDLDNDSGFLTEHQDISGKLDANKLPEAINTALAQANASGEFNGKDGIPGLSVYFLPDRIGENIGELYFLSPKLINTNSREVCIGDLIISSTGYLYSVKSFVLELLRVECLAKLQASTFGYDELVEVMPRVVIQNASGFNQGNAIIVDTINLVVGQEYIVNWNGVEYSCVATLNEIGEDSFSIIIGNVGAMVGQPSNTNEPFAIGDVHGDPYAYIYPLDGSDSLSVSIYKNVAQKMDNKHLDLDWLPVADETVILDEETVANGRVSAIDSKYLVQDNPVVIYINGIPHNTKIEYFENDGWYAVAEVKDTVNVYGLVSCLFTSSTTNVISSRGNVLSGFMEGQTVKICLLEYNKIPEDFLPDLGEKVDLTGYATEQYVLDYAQPKGEYLTEVPEGYAKTEDIPSIPTAVSAFENDAGYLTEHQDLSGYAKTENIPTRPEDIGAQPSGNYLTEVPSGYATEEFVKNKIAEAELGGEEVDLSGYAQKSEIPTKVSQLQNDTGFLTEHQDISGKLDASALPTAINTALAQAKASGEFDGKDGVDGQDGKDGQDYVLTKDDRTEIAELAAELVNVPGSGEGVCYVMVTKLDNGTVIADKTIAEIWQAFGENRAIYCVYMELDSNGNMRTVPLVLALGSGGENFCDFFSCYASGAMFIAVSVSITDDEVTVNREIVNFVKTVNEKVPNDKGNVNITVTAAEKQAIIDEVKSYVDDAILGGEW